MLLRPAFAGFETFYATSNADLARREGIENAFILPDTNRARPLLAFRCLWVAVRLMAHLRPDVVVTTGAAPGFMCILAGRLFGARTMWIDSVANAEQLSGSGRLARHVAARVVTQWEHLAHEPRVVYVGSVL